jgi:SAM-dependent methyltransferase
MGRRRDKHLAVPRRVAENIALTSINRLLGDAPDRSYATKLELFGRFVAPDLRRIFADLNLPAAGAVLDLGCGPALTTELLSEQMGPDAQVVGLDLSLPHLRSARRQRTLRLVQGDALSLAFRAGAFDLIWACNTLNHIGDASAALRALRRCLRADGRVAVAQSGFLPEMFFAWDAPLDDAVRLACHRYYRERYGLNIADTAAIRDVGGVLRAAGFGSVVMRTYVIERAQPLSDADRDYFRRAIFEGTWGERLDSYLCDADRGRLRRNCEPNSPGYCLDRADFHHLQTLTVCEGRC